MNKRNKVVTIIKLFVVTTFLLFLPVKAIAKKQVNIVALGDSITAGYGVLYEQSYSYLIYDYLVNNYSNYNFSYENYAISGSTTTDLIKQLTTNSMQETLSGADIAFISIGSNDILKYIYNPNLLKCLNVGVSICEQEIINIYNEIETNIPNIKTNLTIINNLFNHNCLVVILPFYNPYNTLNNNNSFISSINSKLNTIKDDLNNYLVTSYPNDLIITDMISPLEQESNFNINFITSNYDPHPNIIGHKVISTIIINDQAFQDYFVAKKFNYLYYFIIIGVIIGSGLLIVIWLR